MNVMANLEYILVGKKNPLSPEAPKKFYAVPVWKGLVGIEQLAKEIAGRSSLTVGDILNVLQNFLDIIPDHLLNGEAVDLEKIGILRISFGSRGAVSVDEFDVSYIRAKKIIYLPSMYLKNDVLGKTKFQRISANPKARKRKKPE